MPATALQQRKRLDRSSDSSNTLRDQVASSAALLRSRAEARVLALVPPHSLRDRFDAIDAAVVEAGESQPVLGPLLRLVAELYRQAAHHYCAACDLVDRGDVEFDRAAPVRGASANCGDDVQSGGVAETAEVGDGKQIAGAPFEPEGAEQAALQDSSPPAGAQSGSQSHRDDSAFEAAGSSGGGEGAGVSTAPEQATGRESAREVTEEAQQLGFQDNPKRGFKVRWEDGGGTHRPSYQFSARASAGSSRYGSTRGTTRSPRSSDEGSWEDGDGVSGAEVTGVGDGGVPDAPGGGGDMDAASLLARRMSLVSDRFRGSSFGSGVAKLDLTDMEGKIREERQRRTAAFKAERARLAAGGR